MNEFQQLIYSRLDKIESSNLPLHIKKVAKKVSICRTNAMPGRLYSCPKDKFSIFFRESCNSRSCPTCQSENKRNWKLNTKELVLDSPHYHLVFKLPTFCYQYISRYYKDFIDILFMASNNTIQKILNHSKLKYSTPGFISVLHTHGDELQLHPHIHMMLSSVALDKDNHKLVKFNNDFYNLNDFQDIYLFLLKKELLKLHKNNPELGELFYKQVVTLREQRIFLSQKYDSPIHLLDYLAKTIKGAGINLSEIDKVQDLKIQINKKGISSTLSEDEFVRRYLLQILPSHTKSVRYMGLYSTASRTFLQEAKLLLAEEIFYHLDVDSFMDNDIQTDSEILPVHKFCPYCNSKMILAEKVDEYKAPKIVRLWFGKDPPIEDLFKRLVA